MQDSTGIKNRGIESRFRPVQRAQLVSFGILSQEHSHAISGLDSPSSLLERT